MNVESLSKKKIVERVLTEYFEGDRDIAKTIIEEEVVDMHNFNIVKFIEKTVDITKEEFRKRVEQLLKEVEKAMNYSIEEEILCLEKGDELETDWWSGHASGLSYAYKLIKGAFSGVLRE